jgi:hypothetical protein
MTTAWMATAEGELALGPPPLVLGAVREGLPPLELLQRCAARRFLHLESIFLFCARLL